MPLIHTGNLHFKDNKFFLVLQMQNGNYVSRKLASCFALHVAVTDFTQEIKHEKGIKHLGFPYKLLGIYTISSTEMIFHNS
jgi:hypothetical protein